MFDVFELIVKLHVLNSCYRNYTLFFQKTYSESINQFATIIFIFHVMYTFNLIFRMINFLQGASNLLITVYHNSKLCPHASLKNAVWGKFHTSQNFL